MPCHTSSTRAIECSPPAPDDAPAIVCLSCGDAMALVRTIPKLGVRPEKLIFVCPSCNRVDTKEVKRGA
jgi:hypothetical protein